VNIEDDLESSRSNRVHINGAQSVWPWILFLSLSYLSPSIVHAADSSPESDNLKPWATQDYEIGIEIGVLSFLGPDVRLFIRQAESPWLIGFRYLDIEDDFLNESAVGLPDDSSDKEFTERSGFFLSYLFDETGSASYYLSGAIYRIKTTVECPLGKDSDSATGAYFGGGYRKKWSPNLGYNIGLMISPGSDISVNSEDCSSESDGEIDLNASLIFAF